jgi:hypothetical protein
MKISGVKVSHRKPKGRYAFEKGDCAVRALSFAKGISYEAAHEIVAKGTGRKNRQGTPYSKYYHCIEENGFLPYDGWRKLGKTTGKVLPALAEAGGRWIVTVTGHYTCLVNGTMKDIVFPGPRTRVLAVHLLCEE